MVQPGSIGPLEEILGGLPPDFAATVLAVIHVAENIPNFLDAHQRKDEGRLQVYLQEILAYFIQSRLSCEKVIRAWVWALHDRAVSERQFCRCDTSWRACDPLG